MCNSNCKEEERDLIIDILKEFKCLESMIDNIEKTYKKKKLIKDITTKIAESNDFIYYGGPPRYKIVNNSDSEDDILNNFDRETEYSSHYNYWLLVKEPNEEMPNDITTHCLCFNCIKNYCFIKNIKTKKLYTIGIECINKFIKKRRTCLICLEEHRNSKDNYCNDCRIEYKDKITDLNNERIFRKDNICKFGKYKGVYLDIVCQNKQYIKWAFSIFDINKKDNIYFLLKYYKEQLNQ